MRYAQHEKHRNDSQVGRGIRHLGDAVSDRHQEVWITVGLFAIQHIGVKQEAADWAVGQFQTAQNIAEIQVPHVTFCLAGGRIGFQIWKDLSRVQIGENISVLTKDEDARLNFLWVKSGIFSGLDIEIFDGDGNARSLNQLVVIDLQTGRKRVLRVVLIQTKSKVFQFAGAVIPGNAD